MGKGFHEFGDIVTLSSIIVLGSKKANGDKSTTGWSITKAVLNLFSIA